jgi:hypothetical protein
LLQGHAFLGEGFAGTPELSSRPERTRSSYIAAPNNGPHMRLSVEKAA